MKPNHKQKTTIDILDTKTNTKKRIHAPIKNIFKTKTTFYPRQKISTTI